mmetsp:Transcript_13180/g.17227  ORF Transcript_13180/g.17227 Transcript_13180/m.17227 type:complete len:95 (-) Transcript_13180:4-288(-)
MNPFLDVAISLHGHDSSLEIMFPERDKVLRLDGTGNISLSNLAEIINHSEHYGGGSHNELERVPLALNQAEVVLISLLAEILEDNHLKLLHSIE